MPRGEALTAGSRSIDTRVHLETPEHVVLPVTVAGPAARAVAYGIDLLLRGFLLAIVALAAGAFFPSLDLEGVGVGLGFVVWFLLDWGWYAAFETWGDGRSPGKTVMGLRVVRADGAPIGGREAMLRNLLRAADGFPGFYVVGTLVSVFDPRFRRLGDLVAGTLVVYVPVEEPLPPPVPIDPPVSDTERPRLPRHRRVTPTDHRALEEFLAASARHGPVWSEWVAARVVDGFSEKYKVKARTPVRTLQLLVASARAEAPEIERAAASGRDDARALRRLLDEAEAMEITPEAAPQLVQRFRNLVGELGRLRAGASSRARAAEDLATLAQRHVYQGSARRLRLDLRVPIRVLLEEFPSALRANRQWFALAAALFVLPLLYGAWGAAVYPRFAESLVSPEAQAALGDAYRDLEERSSTDNAMMAGFYVNNNVGIALRAVAGGVFAGIGSAWTLIWNGLVIGATAGWLFREGILGNLLRFTSGHSAWELTAVVVAGAAGLRLGASLILAEGRSRRDALRAAGPDVLRLAAGAATMLLIAAAIEGFWSGSTWPDLVRAAFALVQVLLVFAWLTGRVSAAPFYAILGKLRR